MRSGTFGVATGTAPDGRGCPGNGGGGGCAFFRWWWGGGALLPPPPPGVAEEVADDELWGSSLEFVLSESESTPVNHARTKRETQSTVGPVS